MPTFKQRITEIIPGLVICAGIAALLCVLWVYARYTVNIPYPDDYILSLDFLLKFSDTESTAVRYSLLLERYESHILFFLYLSNLLLWKLFGELNFLHVIFLAFVFLLVLTFLLQKQCQGPNRDLHALTVALLSINAMTYGTTLLPNNSMLNYPVLALVTGALLLLAKTGYLRLVIAALMVTLATFSAGNGMFGFVAGAALLLIRRDYKALLAWSAWSAITVYTFLQIFGISEDYVLATGLALSIKSLFVYYFTFLGSIAQVLYFYSRPLSFVFGIFIFMCCVFLLQKKYYNKNPVVSALIMFMLITGAVVTAGRGGNVYSDALVPRYTINSCLLVALLYIAFTELYDTQIQRLHAAALCFFAVLFSIAALLVSLPAIKERQQRLTAAAERYVTQADNSGFASIHPAQDLAILEQAADHNIYHMAAATGRQAPYKVPPKKILAVVAPSPR